MTKHDPHFSPEPVDVPDAWHRHTPDEGLPQEEHAPQANPYILAGVGAVLSIGFVALVIIVILYFFAYATAIRRQKIETTDPAAESYAYRDESLKRLNQGSYAWVDLTHCGTPEAVALEDERVQIPMDRAIEKVLASYGPHGEGR